MQQQLHDQLKQQQLQMQAQTLQQQPQQAAAPPASAAVYAAEPPSGPSAVSQSPDRDTSLQTLPAPATQLGSPGPNPQVSNHSSQPSSSNTNAPAEQPPTDQSLRDDRDGAAAGTAHSGRVSNRSGADKVSTSTSRELPQDEEEHTDTKIDTEDTLKSHSVPAPRSAESQRTDKKLGSPNKVDSNTNQAAAVVESASSAMDKSTSALGEPEESGISTSNATVWWRAPWSLDQTAEPESLVRPSSVKASQELSSQVPSPTPTNSSPAPKTTSSAPKNTKNSTVSAFKGSRSKPMALRSPPTPVPLVLSASATTLSPAQQTSLSQIAKPSTPSPSGYNNPSLPASSASALGGNAAVEGAVMGSGSPAVVPSTYAAGTTTKPKSAGRYGTSSDGKASNSSTLAGAAAKNGSRRNTGPQSAPPMPAMSQAASSGSVQS